ncbi:MAG TPA: MFS transporter, partial [Alphaproteobacteria bacterium]|nr:MFS transporter [Alphaproteobacteria bacterium]
AMIILASVGFEGLEMPARDGSVALNDGRAAEAFRAWRIVIVGFVALSVAFSARASLGLVLPTWEAEFGWSRSMVSFGGAVALVVMAAVAPFAGALVDRHGPRALLGGGLALIGAGFLTVAPMQSSVAFFIGYGGLAALGFGGVATHVVATAVAGAVDRHRGLATGIATAGATAGQLVIVPAVAVLLGAVGWRASVAVLGGVALALGPLALAVIGRRQPRTASPDAALPPLGQRLGALARSPVFHLLFWSFTICGFTTTGVIETHLLPYAALCGFPPLPSATAYGVLSAVNMAGMVAAGWLTDRVNRPLLLSGIYAMRALSFVLLMAVAQDIGLLFLFAVLFGLFDYSTVPVTASLVASHLGLRVMGLAMGLISAGHAIGAAAGAFLGGWLFDLFAAYQSLWVASFLLAVAAALMALAIGERREEPVPA